MISVTHIINKCCCVVYNLMCTKQLEEICGMCHLQNKPGFNVVGSQRLYVKFHLGWYKDVSMGPSEIYNIDSLENIYLLINDDMHRSDITQK